MELLCSPAAPPPSHGRQMFGKRFGRRENIPESPRGRSRKRLHLPVCIDAVGVINATPCRVVGGAGRDRLTSTTTKTAGPNLWTGDASSTRRTYLYDMTCDI